MSGAPLLLTAAQLAAAARLSVTATRQRLAPLTPRRGEGRAQLFDAAEALPLLFATGDRLDASQERARLDKARADLAELELARKRRELIPAQEVIDHWTRVVGICRGRLLAMPARIAPAALRAADVRACELVVRDEVHAALTELSDNARRGLPDEPAPEP